MTISVGKSSGSLIMPSLVALSQNVGAHTSNSTQSDCAGIGFWTAIDVDHTQSGYTTSKYSSTSDTNEQTMIDISGAGVLTNVMTPSVTSATVTIIVTADGIPKTYTIATGATADRALIGGFAPWEYNTGSTGVVGIGGEGSDYGLAQYHTLTMLTPVASILTMSMPIGIKFSTSLKVTIQSTVAWSASAQLLESCVCYLNHIPEGL